LYRVTNVTLPFSNSMTNHNAGIAHNCGELIHRIVNKARVYLGRFALLHRFQNFLWVALD
jgi:hypothetical protein